ncbi:TPA: DTW domain-containing protein [Vibrio vulnificus]|uniref:tRNA-uridine aminocarboxypropyltransferase n=1 Tax=Vibrio vulnificus TaxID=672 RepID=UPI0005F1B144|nr:DTW domain-containing protein [Vibrio vulnificus]ELH3007995.1 DTW domain-containing protein [Vibrio vulnificus]ELK8329557.1 DTW domain-containing protein [Vibrio vulnificus]ELN6898261.1 DTW domain-containing protein [Vibrio vulnificus]ELU0082786.1 DTW domain-containing protein [Vibrio vulnificus]ELV8714185.1 DTW domain-containing protein [Vibrio vulnificus]
MKPQACPQCGLRYQCLCDQFPSLQSEVALVLLMHPNEVERETNTGKLLHWCRLPARQFVWQRTAPPQALLDLLSDAQFMPVVLYPSEQSIALSQVKERAQQTQRQPLFIILDATWQEARKMLNKSEWLKALPQLALHGDSASNYQLRRNQQQGNLCTLEIAAELVKQLGEVHNATSMTELLRHYLAAFHADRSGHALKSEP